MQLQHAIDVLPARNVLFAMALNELLNNVVEAGGVTMPRFWSNCCLWVPPFAGLGNDGSRLLTRLPETHCGPGAQCNALLLAGSAPPGTAWRSFARNPI